MKIVYLSNYFNHHQKPLADEMYAELGDGNYFFVETTLVPEFRKQLGYKETTAPYVLKYDGDLITKVNNLIMEADAVIYGEAPLSLIKNRLKSGKLTFRDDECRYRTISRYLKWPIYTYKSFFLNKGYLLCASAFGCRDYYVSGMNPNKCFRWGYFTEVKRYDNIEKLISSKSSKLKHCEEVSILWVGRFIRLKHPELPIKVARMLKDNGIGFHLTMIGTGILENKLRRMVAKAGVQDNFSFLGSMPPQEVRLYMEKSDIFLFTSDRNEGWGAVLNEAMNSACAVVASPVIGSAPYLIKDKHNGLFFKDQDPIDLYKKVKWLVENPKERKEMQKNAYTTMSQTWCPKNASKKIINLVSQLINNEDTKINEGPCSKAPLLYRNWYKSQLNANR